MKMRKMVIKIAWMQILQMELRPWDALDVEAIMYCQFFHPSVEQQTWIQVYNNRIYSLHISNAQKATCTLFQQFLSKSNKANQYYSSIADGVQG